MIRALGAIAAASIFLSGCSAPGAAGKPGTHEITVFAAASLQPAFDKIGHTLLTNNDTHITFNFAGSQTLTEQLTQGAQADVFASADTAHMKTVQDANLLNGSPQLFAHNRLEIAVAKGNPKHIESLQDLARSSLVIVLADPSVPAGKYAKQALAKAGVTVKPASLELEVTAVLNKVALGEADAGIVYVSDVVTTGRVEGVAIPDALNVVADYPIAILAESRDKPGAKTFVDYVLSVQGQAALKQAGFEPA